jgi:predicted PurR-regulated permease PerM
MHPLIVLAILFLAQSIFGLWGVILGVPTCQFVFNYWIKRVKEKEAAGGADAEPPPAPATA